MRPAQDVEKMVQELKDRLQPTNSDVFETIGQWLEFCDIIDDVFGLIKPELKNDYAYPYEP